MFRDPGRSKASALAEKVIVSSTFFAFRMPGSLKTALQALVLLALHDAWHMLFSASKLLHVSSMTGSQSIPTCFDLPWQVPVFVTKRPRPQTEPTPVTPSVSSKEGLPPPCRERGLSQEMFACKCLCAPAHVAVCVSRAGSRTQASKMLPVRRVTSSHNAHGWPSSLRAHKSGQHVACASQSTATEYRRQYIGPGHVRLTAVLEEKARHSQGECTAVGHDLCISSRGRGDSNIWFRD